ncbi:hypothetical protein GW17_00006278 [Ensete ventricosum]|nr:hypothetical protein GW17_00006278 [Ensete ventricosum]
MNFRWKKKLERLSKSNNVAWQKKTRKLWKSSKKGTLLKKLKINQGLLRSQVQSTDEENGDKKRVLACSDLEVSSILESSLNVKEKIISELNMELHNMEATLSNEREQHLNEIKKLNALLNEKVIVLYLCLNFLSL